LSSGAKEIKIRIAGITFAFEGLTNDWVWTDRDRFAALATHQTPDVVVQLHVARADERVLVGHLMSSVDGLRNVYLDEESWAFEFVPYRREIYPQRPPRQVLVFDRRFTLGDLWVFADTGLERPSFSFGLLLPELLTGMLSFYSGLMVHAAVIDDGGRGIVFAGPSGAGKSTMASLWQGHAGAAVLNDDRIILRREDSRWWGYPVPGVGEPRSSSQVRVPVEAAFLVSHGQRNTAEQKGLAQGASALLEHMSLPAYDAGGIAMALELLEELLKEIPVCELGFLPDETAIGFVRAVVRQGEAWERVR